MRPLVFVGFFLICQSSFEQTPDYFANDPKWVCGLWDSNQWGPPPAIPTDDIYVYYLNGDTVLGGNTYHILYKRGETYESGPDPIYSYDLPSGYYLRQDGKSIRFWKDGIDSLLVSYDYQVGDSLKGDVFQICGYNSMTVQKIDSIIVNSEYRKVFYLDTINGPIVTEGIGHQVYLDMEIGEFVMPLCAGIGFDYYLYCYGLDNTPYWDSQGSGGNCFLNVDIQESESPTFSIYPNPSQDWFEISSSYSGNIITSIYALDGSLCLQSEQRKINIESLKSGVYIVEILSNQGSGSHLRLLIE